MSRPNVIVYISDSLRAMNLSCYGYGRDTSPNVDQLADDGIRFDNAFSQAYKTVESSVSILTGLYPPAHQARTTHDSVPPDTPRVAETLRQAGYDTIGLSSMVQVSKRRAFNEGFDEFRELFRTHGDSQQSADWAKLCTDAMIDWLDNRSSDDPFFAFVWSNGTHDPYAPRAGRFTTEDTQVDGRLESLRAAPASRANDVLDLYDDTIRHADDEFGRLLDCIQTKGVYDDTLIIFTADHGELLSEHGRIEHTYAPLRAGLMRLAPDFCESNALMEPSAHIGHLSVLPYDELLRVPLVVKPPGGTRSGLVRRSLVETVDVMPTVADIADVGFDTQGSSLTPMFDSDRPLKQYVYSDTAVSRGLTRTRSVRSTEYKLVRTDWDVSRLRRPRVMDLENTVFSMFRKLLTRSPLLFELPDERADARQDAPDRFKTLRRELDEWLQRCRKIETAPETTELDDQTEKQLRELGYLD